MLDPIESTSDPKVLDNIFRLPEYDGPEDRFTAAWGYVLNREPRLAQAVADILLKDRGIAASVIGVTDHPKCNSLKKPDFLIKCEGLDILVEHKLDALLHQNQLESYIGFGLPQTYVALIAPSFQPVPTEVLSHDYYLKPAGRDHFRWRDFHPSVKSHPGWLTQEFADYMASLGMAPFTLRGVEDIFDPTVKPLQFDDALKRAAAQAFAKAAPSCLFKGTPTRRGLEIRTPGASLTLIYVWAEQRSTCVSDNDGPVLAVSVYERNIEGSSSLENATMATPSGIVVRRHRLPKVEEVGGGTCRITYVSPLVDVIQDTRDETVQCIAELLEVVRSDFRIDVI
ncbi:MAG: hypothetical protein OEL86_18880 [Sulfuritalea sp.]|nr:hypothetical protein [Sulfuritalea sp.]